MMWYKWRDILHFYKEQHNIKKITNGPLPQAAHEPKILDNGLEKQTNQQNVGRIVLHARG